MTSAVNIKIGTPLKEIEKLIIEATLRLADGNVPEAAKLLGIARSTLYYKIEEYKRTN